MTRQALLQHTMRSLSRLPKERLQEVVDFADFLFKKHEEEILQKGMDQLVESSGAFDFLNDEEDIYSADDLKEMY